MIPFVHGNALLHMYSFGPALALSAAFRNIVLYTKERRCGHVQP
jgi:hypothetical protein